MTRAGIKFLIGKLANITIQSDLLERIRVAQQGDLELRGHKEKLEAGLAKDFSCLSDGLLRYKNRICVPIDKEIRQEILDESHTTPYSLHP